jgi:hypothetical protein
VLKLLVKGFKLIVIGDKSRLIRAKPLTVWVKLRGDPVKTTDMFRLKPFFFAFSYPGAKAPGCNSGLGSGLGLRAYESLINPKFLFSREHRQSSDKP